MYKCKGCGKSFAEKCDKGYKNFCSHKCYIKDYHNREHVKNWRTGKWIKPKKCQTTACQKCGWDKASVDTHRIVNGKDGGKYEEGNILYLCPNCHRLEHLKVRK